MHHSGDPKEVSKDGLPSDVSKRSFKGVASVLRSVTSKRVSKGRFSKDGFGGGFPTMVSRAIFEGDFEGKLLREASKERL